MGMALMLILALQDKQERPEAVVVQMESTALRDKPNFAAPRIANAKYGDHFKFLAWEGEWVKVVGPAERVGYLHKNAIVDKKKWVPPQPGKEGDTGGVAMATKGFTPEMEAEHKNNNNLHKAYEKLDRIERTPAYLRDLDIVDARLSKFAKEGNLKQ
jgi:hypothetical protein